MEMNLYTTFNVLRRSCIRTHAHTPSNRVLTSVCTMISILMPNTFIRVLFSTLFSKKCFANLPTGTYHNMDYNILSNKWGATVIVHLYLGTTAQNSKKAVLRWSTMEYKLLLTPVSRDLLRSKDMS